MSNEQTARDFFRKWVAEKPHARRSYDEDSFIMGYLFGLGAGMDKAMGQVREILKP